MISDITGLAEQQFVVLGSPQKRGRLWGPSSGCHHWNRFNL